MNKVFSAVALAGVGVLALSGCSTPAPSSAAVVNGTTLTQAQVEQTAQALSNATQQDLAQSTQAVLTNEVLGQVATKVAAENKITLDSAARTAALDDQLTALRSNPALTALVDRYADVQVVSKKLGYDAFVTACQKVPVQVNPRYGTWSSELCALTPDGTLSKPAPTGAAR